VLYKAYSLESAAVKFREKKKVLKLSTVMKQAQQVTTSAAAAAI